MALSNPFLTELAAAFGIATEFWDWKGRLTEVDDETVVGVLKAMEVDASTPELAAAVAAGTSIELDGDLSGRNAVDAMLAAGVTCVAVRNEVGIAGSLTLADLSDLLKA